MSTPSDLSALRIDRTEPTRSAGGGRLPLILALLAVVLAVGALEWWRSSARPLEVKVGTAEATGGGSASGDGITANGYVVARTKASVSAKILGRMASLGVAEGSEAREGTVIARIEDSDYQAALASARANLGQFEAQITQARRDLKRTQALRGQNLVAEADLENAQTRLDVLEAQRASAQAQVKVAEASLENTLVRAPFTGTVLRKDAEVGEIVAPSSAGGGLTRTSIVTMADLRTLEVEVDVNEAYIAQVRGGQSAKITLDAYPDTAFSGRVRQVVPTADRQKATVLVKVSILDRDPRILPEMGAKVVFDSRGAARAAAPRRVLVPASSVVQAAGDASVWIVDGGKVRRMGVDVGATRGDRVEIRQGLAGGESLVLEPPATLRDGQAVKVESR
jgi:RND family efflux transporter MFP subunit